MNIISKLQQIIEIQNVTSKQNVGDLNSSISEDQINQIEKLIGEPLSNEFKELYNFANGQLENGKGILFGERFISSDEIVRNLEFSLTLVKPENKFIDNQEQSNELIKKIVDFYIDKAPKHKLFGIKKSWYKIEFKCSISSYGGPYLYSNESTTPHERKTFEIDYASYKSLSEIIKELHELEKSTYNWDELEFIVFSDGKNIVERRFYDFDNQINFSSTPENSIKKKYFHYKWLPLFSDYSGNYIGIDFDPDVNGIKGQIINFGRDEEKMIVLAENLENFFDFILTECRKPDNKLMSSKYHLHELLIDLKNNCA